MTAQEIIDATVLHYTLLRMKLPQTPEFSESVRAMTVQYHEALLQHLTIEGSSAC